jgi:hypothetical protein
MNKLILSNAAFEFIKQLVLFDSDYCFRYKNKRPF